MTAADEICYMSQYLRCWSCFIQSHVNIEFVFQSPSISIEDTDFLSLFLLTLSEMNSARFLSFCWGQTKWTLVGFTLIFYVLILHFSCPFSPLLFSQGRGHFYRYSSSLVTTARCGLVSWAKLSCGHWKYGHPGMSITAFMILRFKNVRAGGLWIKH